jgi:uncharacterized membrane protein YkoI
MQDPDGKIRMEVNMMNIKLAGIAAVLAIILTFGGWQLSKHMSSAEPLTEAEAAKKVRELYPGKIVEVSRRNGRYLITIELDDTGTYEVEIDGVTGEIEGMKRTKKQGGSQPEHKPEQPSQPETPTEAPEKSEPGGKPATIITEKEAASIALSRVNGEIDEIELEVSGGISYYLVELETDEDDATIQINAISGEVMSITWDD